MHALNPVKWVGVQFAEAIHLHEKVRDEAADTRVRELLERLRLPARRPATRTSCRAASASG